MKRLMMVLAMVALLGLPGLCLAADGAAPGNGTISVLNNANFDIYSVAVSPTNANQWETQQLSQKVLANGDTVDLMAAQTPNAKAWDLQVTDKNGNSITWIGLPLNKAGQITLLPNGAYLVDGKLPAGDSDDAADAPGNATN